MGKDIKQWKIYFSFLILLTAACSIYHESYIGKFSKTINIDGIGYNAFLPALLLNNDNLNWSFIDTSLKNNPAYKNGFQEFRYTVNKNKKINKYAPGLALTQLPFWICAWSIYDFSSEVSGYELPFQIAVFVNNLFWLFVGLWLFSKLLIKHQWPAKRILLLYSLLLFATNLFHFITFDNSLTHPVSLGFVLIAIYYLDRYKSNFKLLHLTLFLAVFGILVLIRPFNVLMLGFFVFFYFWTNDKKPKIRILEVIFGFIAAFITAAIYFGFIYWQTGSFFVYTYQNEQFNFTNLEIGSFLFGYKCGLFIYTPIIILCFIFWTYSHRAKLIVAYIFYFLAIIWIMSCWGDQCYGCRVGNRPMVDYFGFLLIPLLDSNFKITKTKKIGVLLFILFCTYYNQIIHYQYRHYILDWCNVTKSQYWQNFLQTHKNTSAE